MTVATSTKLNLDFDINDYTERLTPSKGNRFYCPICNTSLRFKILREILDHVQ